MKYLVFRLYGPMASWGKIAIGGVRRSSSHPTKSAIIGLVAAALGIKRLDEEKQKELIDKFSMAVKVISSGDILTDFHTTQIPKIEKGITHKTRKSELQIKNKLKTILSNREYRTDSLSIIALWQKGNSIINLEKICYAIKYPKYILYLGRKSCPISLPLGPKLLDADTLKQVLDSYKFSPVCLNLYNEKKNKQIEEKIFQKNKVLYFWEEHENPGMIFLHKTPSYDLFLSRKRWQFTSRDEFMCVDE